MIEGKQEFKKVIRGAGENEVFINVQLSNGRDIYFSDYDDWLKVKHICSSEGLKLIKLALQFRTHLEEVDISDADAVYLVRSVMGQIGQKSRRYLTTGSLVDGVVHKKMWLTPELIVEKEYEDTIEACFEEAMIYNGEGTKR
jgi:hypothetical protein